MLEKSYWSLGLNHFDHLILVIEATFFEIKVLNWCQLLFASASNSEAHNLGWHHQDHERWCRKLLLRHSRIMMTSFLWRQITNLLLTCWEIRRNGSFYGRVALFCEKSKAKTSLFKCWSAVTLKINWKKLRLILNCRMRTRRGFEKENFKPLWFIFEARDHCLFGTSKASRLLPPIFV